MLRTGHLQDWARSGHCRLPNERVNPQCSRRPQAGSAHLVRHFSFFLKKTRTWFHGHPGSHSESSFTPSKVSVVSSQTQGSSIKSSPIPRQSPHAYLSRASFPKCGHLINSRSTTQELAKNVNFQHPPETSYIRNSDGGWDLEIRF